MSLERQRAQGKPGAQQAPAASHANGGLRLRL